MDQTIEDQRTNRPDHVGSAVAVDRRLIEGRRWSDKAGVDRVTQTSSAATALTGRSDRAPYVNAEVDRLLLIEFREEIEICESRAARAQALIRHIQNRRKHEYISAPHPQFHTSIRRACRFCDNPFER